MTGVMSVHRRASRPSSSSFPRILYVDDEPMAREAFVRTVGPRGFLVDVAASAAEAFERAANGGYAVVVTDMHMPGVSGATLIRRILPRALHTEFVVVTGSVAPALPTDDAFRERVSSLIQKPWDDDHLVATLHRAVRRSCSRSRPNPSEANGRVRALVLEDDPHFLEVASRYLAADGTYEVTTASRLGEALALLERDEYELVLSDLTLPDARGLDAVLRVQSVAPRTAIVAMSGADDRVLALEVVRAGAQDYLVKGAFDAAGLARSIRHARERKRGQEALVRRANEDELTGLANRSQLLTRLQQALARARRRGEQLALLYMDLDGFKAVNDSLGHAAGDELLVQVARRLTETARDTDLVARLGGDEFAVLVDAIPGPEEAVLAGRRLLSALSAPYGSDAARANVSASVGLACFPEGGETALELIKAADAAMYRAKRAGKSSLVRYRRPGPAPTDPTERMRVAVQRALRNGELELWFEPQVNGAEDVCAVHARPHWVRPHGVLGPDRLSPILEEVDATVAVGRWVLDAACHHLSQWRAAQIDLTRAIVPISSQQLRSDCLFDALDRALNRYQLRGAQVEIEIAERAVLEHVEDAVTLLTKLKRDLDVRITIREFGRDHGSLLVLHQLPWDVVKIDRSIVRELPSGVRSRSVVCATLAAARELDLEVVAEGVETDEQRAWLEEAGCHRYQGRRLFGGPRPAPEVSSASVGLSAAS